MPSRMVHGTVEVQEKTLEIISSMGLGRVGGHWARSAGAPRNRVPGSWEESSTLGVGVLLPKLARKSVRPSVPVRKPAQRMATFHRSTPPARGRSPVDALENLCPWLAGPVISEYEWWGAAPRALVTADSHRGSWDRGRDGLRGMLCTEGPASCRYERQELGQTPRTKHPDWPP